MTTLSDTDLEAVIAGIMDALLPAIESKLAPIRTRLDALEARPVGVKYCGVWQNTASYELHEAVTSDGSLWICRTPNTSMRPGSSPGAWQLAVKRGSDGKDAR